MSQKHCGIVGSALAGATAGDFDLVGFGLVGFGLVGLGPVGFGSVGWEDCLVDLAVANLREGSLRDGILRLGLILASWLTLGVRAKLVMMGDAKRCGKGAAQSFKNWN